MECACRLLAKIQALERQSKSSEFMCGVSAMINRDLYDDKDKPIGIIKGVGVDFVVAVHRQEGTYLRRHVYLLVSRKSLTKVIVYNDRLL